MRTMKYVPSVPTLASFAVGFTGGALLPEITQNSDSSNAFGIIGIVTAGEVLANKLFKVPYSAYRTEGAVAAGLGYYCGRQLRHYIF